MIKYKITLTKEEREELELIVRKGKHTSVRVRNALILLNFDEGNHSAKYTNQIISDVLKVSMRTIDRIKKKFVEEGYEAVIYPGSSKREYVKKIDGDLEAHLVALCCSDTPAGYSNWSLRLLADKMVELKYIDSISHETVRQILKKTNLNHGKV